MYDIFSPAQGNASGMPISSIWNQMDIYISRRKTRFALYPEIHKVRSREIASRILEGGVAGGIQFELS